MSEEQFILSERGRDLIEKRLSQLKQQGDPIQKQRLATALGMHPSGISKLLAGAPISYHRLDRLAGILQLHVADLHAPLTDGLPDWAPRLERLFEARFEILSVNDRMPVAIPLGTPFSLTAPAKRYESKAQEEAGNIDEPIGVVPTATVQKRAFKRDQNRRLMFPYEVGRWSQLTAMRMAHEPCYDLYVGAVVLSSDFSLLINRRSGTVRTWPGAYASYGGTFFPHDAKRTDTFRHDIDLLDGMDREIREETKIRDVNITGDENVLIMLEKDYTNIGNQNSVQMIALHATFPKVHLDAALKLKLAEGTAHAVPFDPGNLDHLARFLLEEDWAPCGLAHHLVWLARGGPGLPPHYQQYALRLFDHITDQMQKRGSWRRRPTQA